MGLARQTASVITPETLLIGDWTFHADTFQLEKDNETVKLEPRVAELLSFLATHANTTVSREQLMEAIWPGMVVGDEALTNGINKLRKAFGDNRQHPRIIKTIPKAGYRLIAPVQSIAAHAPATTGTPSGVLRASNRRWLVAVITAVITLVIVLLWLGSDQSRRSPDRNQAVVSTRPIIAVLPFDNLDHDPEQEYFADGVTDDIITRLAKIPSLMVIARDSTFLYKDAGVDIRTIAAKLNAGNVLRGSIRKSDDQLVVNVQLIDAATGTHTWAEQYSANIADLFRLEDRIAAGVINVLLDRQQGDDALRPTAMPTSHAQAHDYLLLGRYHFYKFESKEENIKARKLFGEAIELDPDYALAYAFLAWTYIFEAMNGWTDDRPATLEQAERLAGVAIELQPELPLSYYVRGLTYREQRNRNDEALGEAETALKYDPNNANAKVLLASLLYYADYPEIGLTLIRDAMRINPHHPYNYHFHLGQVYFVMRQYEDARQAFEQGLASNPAAERLRVWLAATYAQAGDIESATWEAEQVLTSNPEFSVARMEETFHFKDPADLKHFTDGLRLAGFH